MKRDPLLRKAIRVSLLLHGVAFLLLIFSLFWNRLFSEPPPQHVFELVSVDSPEQPELSPPTPQDMPVEQIETIQLPALPELDQREVKIPEPQPEPPPKLVEKPKTQPKPEVLDYRDFLKTNKLPEKPRQVQQRPREISAPKIDISQIRRELNQSLSSADSARVNQMSQAAQNQLFDYMSRVRNMIDAAFVRPDNLPYQRFEAIVEFKVEPNGRVSHFKLIRSSGNESFDAAVLAAFRRIRLPPTPDGESYLWKIPFVVKER